MEFTRVDVLIVDDDSAIRAMLRLSLQRRGIVCEEARDGVEALERLHQLDCAVILLDLTMPRLNGFGFLEAFVDSRRPDQQPIIFVMSAGGDEQLRRTRPDTVHAIVRKPFDVFDLADVVESCVALRWTHAPPGRTASPARRKTL